MVSRHGWVIRTSVSLFRPCLFQQPRPVLFNCDPSSYLNVPCPARTPAIVRAWKVPPTVSRLLSSRRSCLVPYSSLLTPTMDCDTLHALRLHLLHPTCLPNPVYSPHPTPPSTPHPPAQPDLALTRPHLLQSSIIHSAPGFALDQSLLFFSLPSEPRFALPSLFFFSTTSPHLPCQTSTYQALETVRFLCPAPIATTVLEPLSWYIPPPTRPSTQISTRFWRLAPP
ncbi:hypothetical protein CTAM01_09271 [Colletotrichum tamarilloi]|uniref:Uncharacterized protein n=1 Tax=Colletotrichum tamarilloi TaxID=1209934 RepID=A0ABQ9R3P3_9PEZI|nr:uncharacterized protein CTAM01_09271 [Colletotrichum tamarilloi]KAK1493810.1 hypothetical protein CTAM01_09271 [Colletotrichum tamarilloi]